MQAKIISLRFFSSTTPLAFVPSLLQKKPIVQNLQQIYQHPFNQELFNGTLNPITFSRYLNDDKYYLRHYALSLKKLAVRSASVNPLLAKQLDALAKDIVGGEQKMQERYKKYLIPGSKPGHAITEYVDFLVKNTDNTELSVALSGVLPCFEIYYRLGTKKLPPSQLLRNPYRNWIRTYSSPEFVEATQQLTQTINQMAKQSDIELQTKMEQAFAKAVEHELLFFNESYGCIPSQQFRPY